MAPWRRTASKAYCEQLGVNRQAGGSAGEMNRWYPRISSAIPRATSDGPPATPLPRCHPDPPQQVGPKLRKTGPIRLPTNADHYVPIWNNNTDFPPPQLPEPTLQTIAGHRRLPEPRYDQSQTGVARCSGRPMDVQCCPANPASRAQDPPHLRPRHQPARAPKALGAGQTRACFEPMETVSRFRPFFRRRDSTARPQRSAIRFRKPCLAIRRLFRGRYVGIMA